MIFARSYDVQRMELIFRENCNHSPHLLVIVRNCSASSFSSAALKLLLPQDTFLCLCDAAQSQLLIKLLACYKVFYKKSFHVPFFFFHHFEVSEGVLRNKPTFKKAKKYGDQTEGLVGDHFCVSKKKWIYIKSPKYHWMSFV